MSFILLNYLFCLYTDLLFIFNTRLITYLINSTHSFSFIYLLITYAHIYLLNDVLSNAYPKLLIKRR
jgi:hypothetical protein